MILGLGSDLTDIRRIEKSLERFGVRFENRIFTPAEQKKARSRPLAVAATYAKRFAAKEACAKALGTGLHRGVFWRDMEVINLPSGRPALHLSGGALKQLEALMPKGMKAVIHLSLSDEYPLAQAQVIISAEPL
ncbi:MAG: holo-ACP synthase [Pseudomonadota bacterium]|nr:holo-ACP synthase [Pseudomonadota bacterium]